MSVLSVLNRVIAHPKERILHAIPLLFYAAITNIFFTAIGTLIITGVLPGGYISGGILIGVGALGPILCPFILLYRNGSRHKREKKVAATKLISVRSPFSEAKRNKWETEKVNW